MNDTESTDKGVEKKSGINQDYVCRLTDEDIGRILRERCGGRIAGRGDSPYDQDFYENLYGLKKNDKEEGDQ